VLIRSSLPLEIRPHNERRQHGKQSENLPLTSTRRTQVGKDRRKYTRFRFVLVLMVTRDWWLDDFEASYIQNHSIGKAMMEHDETSFDGVAARLGLSGSLTILDANKLE